MGFLEFLARAFINTFGITEPKPSQLRTAAWFIAGLMALVLVLVVAAGLILRHLIYR
jgi:hypothetical protein